MIDFLFNLILWIIIGAVPGFYAAYFKQHDPLHGVAAGAVGGIVIGLIGGAVGLIDTLSAAVVTLFSAIAIVALLVPVGTYTQSASRRAQTTAFAYTLMLPTVLIVLGIVVFPVIWNLIFSFRDISTADLRTVDVFDVSGADLERYDERLGLTVATTECRSAFAPYFILYEGGFNPDDASAGFVVVETGARDPNGEPIIEEDLLADQPYVLVMTGQTEALELNFEVTFEGPGTMLLGDPGAPGTEATQYSGTTSAEQIFARPSRTGSRLEQGAWWYHAQPIAVSEAGTYRIKAASTEFVCRRDNDGNIVYQTLSDAGRSNYDNLITVNLGAENFVIGARDPGFYDIIVRTMFYTLSGTILAIMFGLVAALVVRDAFPGRGIFRGFILFPYIAPVVSVAFVWQVMLGQAGPINSVIDMDTSLLNAGAGDFVGIAMPLFMAILFQAWRYFPFAFLFLLARIQAIPDDLYEAAKVDGASPVQRLWFITLPQLRAVFGTLFLLRFIWTFNKFDDIFLLVGTTSETKVITVEIFDALFNVQTPGNISQASAIAMIMAVMLAVVLMIYFRFFLVEED